MNTYIIFLRGINVGGNAKVSMDILKKALIAKEYSNVKTYINSGNLLVSTPQDKIPLIEDVREIIKTQFGISVELIVKTKSELDYILTQDPFDKGNETDNSKKIVAMLSKKIDPEKTQVFKEDSKIEENFYVNGDLLYIYYHNGAGQSKFTNNYIEKKLKVTSTARNWNTILKMAEMCKTI
jgi:uncharacterized protein (DUF1697 family)